MRSGIVQYIIYSNNNTIIHIVIIKNVTLSTHIGTLCFPKFLVCACLTIRLRDKFFHKH